MTAFEFSLTPAGDSHADALIASAAVALRAAGFDAVSEVTAGSHPRVRLRVAASDIYEAWHAVFEARRAVYDAGIDVSDLPVRSIRSEARV